MIAPELREIDGKTYVLTKFPATKGREIVTQYLSTGLPKIGDYQRNEELMLKLMCYVGIPQGDNKPPLMLISDSLINNHVPSWEVLLKIEMAMMEYNCGFFQDGRALAFLDGIAQKVPQWIIKMLTHLSQQLSQITKQP